MIAPSDNTGRLLYLADVVCDGRASDTDLAELDAILSGDETIRQEYFDYCQLHATLELDLRAQRVARKAWEQIDAELPTCSAVARPIVTPSSAGGVASAFAPSYVVAALSGAGGFFSSGWPLAYLVATLVTGIAILVGSLIHVSQPEQLAQPNSPLSLWERGRG